MSLIDDGSEKISNLFGSAKAAVSDVYNDFKNSLEKKPTEDSIKPKTTRIKTLEDKLAKGKRRYKYLKFPLDVDTEATQNIMLININAISGSKFAGTQYRVVEGDEARVEQKGSNSLSRHFSGNTVRVDTAIALHMPPSIQSSYQSNWTVSELGVAGAVIDAWGGSGDMTSLQGWKNTWNTGKEVLPEVAKMTAVRVADALLPGKITDAYTWANQMVDNPYVEVLFKGVSNRTFTYTFKFIPRSFSEQQAIKEIIDTLKFHRAPEKKLNSANLYWSYPSTFDISFLKKNGQENEWLFKISTCALTDLNVQYGGDSFFGAFADGSPFSTTVTLSFTELETLDKERILQGY
ncbi:hypothetical protein pf16_205 [Pseudomonas phage pf16]|uniref:Baseplate tail tube cap n=1 Tax=Pseudomonas phage pf16 TaxID=1815630 RepID=A0A1S5R3Y5_9CAUD|nr:hypothetical protein FDG98_gp093 [Pseudomonas phage pf16]AND75128.1 hypothetical protein pf16_205 [Pseudomonas phage pf16]